MSSNLHHTRSEIIDLARVNNVVKVVLEMYNITGENELPFVWERALILAVLELAMRNKHLEEALEIAERYNQAIDIKFNMADLPEEKRVIVLDVLKYLKVQG